jgi:predicted RNA binding protein YcfA (HicA-like mRNA interferase family)
MDLSMNGWMDVNQPGSHNIFVATDELHFDMVNFTTLDNQ